MESDDERLQRFERNWTVGRVIRPRILESDEGGFGAGGLQDSQMLRRLWDEEDHAEDDPEVDSYYKGVPY